jgi:hypothetical protein
MRPPLIAAALVVALLTFASAQATPPTAVRGIIERVALDRESLEVKTRAGEQKTLRLPADAKVTRVVAAALADVKPGAYVGVAAVPGEGGALNALEVHIFPQSMRGVGEGFRPFDLEPGSTMTNGDVAARVDSVDGPRLTVTYNGGQQTIVVGVATPIVALAPGARSDLKVGAAIVARAAKAADGAYDAARILVGKDGLTPPM